MAAGELPDVRLVWESHLERHFLAVTKEWVEFTDSVSGELLKGWACLGQDLGDWKSHYKQVPEAIASKLDTLLIGALFAGASDDEDRGAEETQPCRQRSKQKSRNCEPRSPKK